MADPHDPTAPVPSVLEDAETAVRMADLRDRAASVRKRNHRRLWRAVLMSGLAPLTIFAESPLSWIFFGDWRLDALLLSAAGIALGLWAHWGRGVIEGFHVQGEARALERELGLE